MKRSDHLDRRRFLAVSGAAPGLACARAGRRWRFLTDEEAAIAAAICDQIIPPDEDPGAAETGAVEFIDRQLKGHYKHWQQAYREGLREIDEAARAKFGKPFASLGRAEQLELVREREKTPFFRLITDHTMQSFYGDPRHGGNRDFASWRMLGIANPPVRGRQHYDLRTSK